MSAGVDELEERVVLEQVDEKGVGVLARLVPRKEDLRAEALIWATRFRMIALIIIKCE